MLIKTTAKQRKAQEPLLIFTSEKLCLFFLLNHVTNLLAANLISCKIFLQLFLSSLLLHTSQLFRDMLLPPDSQ